MHWHLSHSTTKKFKATQVGEFIQIRGQLLQITTTVQLQYLQVVYERSKQQRCLRFPTKSGTSLRPEQPNKDKTRIISPSSCGKSHMLLVNTLSHFEIDEFVYRRLPIVFKARGNPLHFLTIFIPISFSSAFNSGLSSWNACLRNTCQQ
ncbi:hypothetical protein CR513_17884, partial [Mucuna pruriens]